MKRYIKMHAISHYLGQSRVKRKLILIFQVPQTSGKVFQYIVTIFFDERQVCVQNILRSV